MESGRQKRHLRVRSDLNRAFSLTWPASMLIFGSKESFYIAKEFIVLEHQYGRRDVMRKRSIGLL